ncbi:hypothetical protein GW746_02110 [Candidatus Saccharibacteria bacterium]|nr:hypothetical protein [Candidatus Saccharibacteria bacterium]NCS83189.1 hypothetical protein [Candidatus Saccharibacteria bacterium]
MTTATQDYVLLSKKGLHELQQSIRDLERDRQNAMRKLKESEKTTSHDDRLERNERLLRLESIESELIEKRQLMANSKLISSRRKRMKVALGSMVDLMDQQGRLFRYTLVDSIEANPSDGRISVQSPLGSSLLGKTANEVVEWNARTQRNALHLVRVY